MRTKIDPREMLMQAVAGNADIDADHREAFTTPLQAAAHIEQLRERNDLLQVKHDFKVGDLIEWKPGLRHKKLRPVCLVTKVLEEPRFDLQTDAGSPYYGESLDLVAAVLDGGGDFIEYHLDSRRMQPYTGYTSADIED